MNIYAVGDIHGHIEKLVGAIQKIREHADGHPARVIFLGDYVDRGLNSRQVVNLIMGCCKRNSALGILHWNLRYEAVLGNHEDLVLYAKENNMTQSLTPQLRVSYLFYSADFVRHCEWFETLPTMIQTENHIFVHAGLDPRHPLETQPERALLWIRRWEDKENDFGKHIVYAHTPHKKPKLLKHSTGLDTGCGFGGSLSVGVFDSEKREGPFEVLEV